MPKKASASAAACHVGADGKRRKRLVGAHSRAPEGTFGGECDYGAGSVSKDLTTSALAEHTAKTSKAAMHDGRLECCRLCMQRVDSRKLSDEGLLLCAECADTARVCFPFRVVSSLVSECDKSEAYRLWFTQCTDARLGRMPKGDWKHTVVVGHRSSCCRTERSYIGLSRTEFHDCFGCNPEVLNLRMQILEDEFGKPYRGVLVADPQRPFRYHVFSSSDGHGKDVEAMGKDEQVFEEQSELAYQWAKGDNLAKWSGQGAKSWSWSALKDKADKYRQSIAHQDSSCHGDATSAVASEDEATRPSPMKHDIGLMECDVVSPLSGAPETKKWRTIKLVKGDADSHSRLTQFWIAKCDLSAVVRGVALGKEKKECWSAADRLSAVEAHGYASQLREHHCLMELCEKLTATALNERPWPDIKETLASVDGNISLSQDTQWQLVKRCSLYFASLDQLDSMVAVLSPWRLRGDHVFDAKSPRLRDLAEDLHHRFKRFESYVVDSLLINALQREAEGAKEAGQLAMAMLKFIVNELDEADVDESDQSPLVPDSMTSSFEAFLLSCRCVSFLCRDGSSNYGEAISDVTQFHARLPKCLGKDSPPARLGVMLRTAYWQTIVDQLRSFEGAEVMAKGDIDSARRVLGLAHPPPRALGVVARFLVAHQGRIRPTIYSDILAKLLDSSKAMVPVLGERSAALASAAEKRAYLDDVVRFGVDSAALGDDFAKVAAQVKPEAKALLQKLADTSLLEDILSQLGSWVTGAELTSLQSALAAAHKASFRIDIVGSQLARPIFDFVQKQFREWERSCGDALLACMHEVLNTCDAIMMVATASDDVTGLISHIDAWRTWASFVDRAERPSFNAGDPFEAREAAMAKFTRLITKVKKVMPTVIKEDCAACWSDPVNAAMDAFDVMAKADAKASQLEVEELSRKLVEKISGHRDSLWHSDLPDDAPWEQVKAHAQKPGGLVSVDVDELDVCLASLSEKHERHKHIMSFYAFDITAAESEAVARNLQSGVLLYVAGCLAIGLGLAQGVTAARKIALKQHRRLLKHNLTLEWVTPPALRDKAKNAIAFKF